MTLYQEIALLLLLLSAVVGGFAIRLKQPLIIAYILVGILAGPTVLGLTQAERPLKLLAEIGITVLLFVVGLKLDTRLIRTLGPVALVTGLGQLTFTIIFGFGLSLLLGLDWLTALYVAVALTFSSTIIIVKLLSDKREIDSLHGRIAMGFLIVQDIAVVVALFTLSLTGTTGGVQAGLSGWGLAAAIIGGLVAIGLLMRFVLPRLLHGMASSPELLMLFAVAWGAALAAGAEYLGMSKEIGAFLAGFSLASTAFREGIASRLGPLRDFLLLFFFLHLGAGLEFGNVTAQILPAVILSLFVLIGNPLIVMAIMGRMGYRLRTGFMAGLTVAQISEFSIIFVATGIGLGHIGEEALSLTTLVGLTTITLSTYMILNSQSLYKRLSPYLGFMERENAYREETHGDLNDETPSVIVYGAGRYGRQLIEQLLEHGEDVLGVDFDPDRLADAREAGLNVRYGNAEDPDFLTHLPLGHARLVVSTIPSHDVNRILLRELKELNYEGRVILSAFWDRDAQAFQGAGAEGVLMPYADAAESAARRLVREVRDEETAAGESRT